MRFFACFSAAVPLLALAACMSPGAAPAPAEPAVAGRCNAQPAQLVIGRMADAALETEARNRSGARTVRVLKPDQIVTMEFNAERLNLHVDLTGKVTRVNCG
jgi:hypothetical protein